MLSLSLQSPTQPHRKKKKKKRKKERLVKKHENDHATTFAWFTIWQEHCHLMWKHGSQRKQKREEWNGWDMGAHEQYWITNIGEDRV